MNIHSKIVDAGLLFGDFIDQEGNIITHLPIDHYNLRGDVEMIIGYSTLDQSRMDPNSGPDDWIGVIVLKESVDPSLWLERYRAYLTTFENLDPIAAPQVEEIPMGHLIGIVWAE